MYLKVNVKLTKKILFLFASVISLSSRVMTLCLKDYEQSPEDLMVKQEKSGLEVDEDELGASKELQWDEVTNLESKTSSPEVVKLLGRPKRSSRKNQSDTFAESSSPTVGKRKIIEEPRRQRRHRGSGITAKDEQKEQENESEED